MEYSKLEGSLMTLRSMLAKDWTIEVQSPDIHIPKWITVRGLTKFEESSDDNSEDDGDFDSGGWGSTVVTQRTWSIECEGKRKRDDAAEFRPDPGQEIVRRAARRVGFDAGVMVRWYRRDGSPDAYQGLATVSDFAKGGEVTDLEPFSFTLNGQGEPVEIPNPLTVDGVTVSPDEVTLSAGGA